MCGLLNVILFLNYIKQFMMSNSHPSALDLISNQPAISENVYDKGQCRCSYCPFSSLCPYCMDWPNRERHREKMENIKVKIVENIIARQHVTEQTIGVVQSLKMKGWSYHRLKKFS